MALLQAEVGITLHDPELSHVRFHDNKDRIYRVAKSVNRPDGSSGMWASVIAQVGLHQPG